MSDDADLEPDSVVRTALRLLPVPEHGPTFWADLDEALALEPPRHADEPALAVGPTLVASDVPHSVDAASEMGDSVRTRPPLVERAAATALNPASKAGPDLALGLVPPSLRRRSNVVLLVVAAAAAALVAVSGIALVHNRADNGLGTGGAVQGSAGGGALPVASPNG